jgi:CheY-like chemotaxis protein
MGKKILLADDSITIQKVIELTFSDEDFDVITVGNGRLAIERVQEVRPDVVLCDIIMPEKDGYEVCEFVKKTPSLAHIPVLLLTGAFEPFDQDRANRVGCDGFLAKPFEPETLIAKVRELLSRAAKPGAGAAAPSAPAPKPAAVPAGELTGRPPTIPFVAPTAREPEPFAPRPAGFVTSAPPRPAEPIPFPRSAAAPPAGPAAFPAPVPASPEPAPIGSFIPDEPFEDLDAGSLSGEESSPGATTAAFAPPREELLPMTPEESQSLSAPSDDSSSTVMFRAESLPWNTPPAPAPAAAPPPAPPAPVVEPSPIAVEPDMMTEVPVFEEVIEEEVEFTPAAAPIPPPPVPFEPLPPPVFTNQPVGPPSFVAPAPPPPPPPVVMAPPPPPPVVMAPPPSVVYEPPPPPPPPVAERATMPAPPAAPEPAPPPDDPAADSFADLGVSEPTPMAVPSEAAGVTVPVEMVEKIAQRVVAQISEKVVREIAWEVIPDLAEAMIRAEIERLKSELQRL